MNNKLVGGAKKVFLNDLTAIIVFLFFLILNKHPVTTKSTEFVFIKS
jgi:hypothetical protein